MEQFSDSQPELQFYKSLKGKDALSERMKGLLPLIIIKDLPYYVNMNFGVLEPSNASFDALNINGLEMDKATRKLSFYYNLDNRSVVSIDKNITELPERVVKVEIPNQYYLDPVAMARKNGRDPMDYKDYGIPLKMYRIAKIIPLKNTGLAAKVKINQGGSENLKGSVMKNATPAKRKKKGPRL